MSGKRKSFSVFVGILIPVFLIVLTWYASTLSSEVHFNSPFSFLNIEINPKANIVIVGDIMLDRNVRNKINELGFDKYFEGVIDLIGSADLAVGNLEGPFTTFPSVTASLKSKELKFTFDPELSTKMAGLGFDVLGLANNHTMNFGREGFKMTKDYINKSSMSYYGDPNNASELSTIINVNGIKVGFVGFHEFTYINFDKVFAEIERIRPEVDFLIVTPHWGIEYQKEPTEKMRKWSHEFIDSGADVVIGAHPHVIGETDEYNGKKIFYSLGNFAFDQYFSSETSEGLAVTISLEKRNHGGMDIEYKTNNIKIGRNGLTL